MFKNEQEDRLFERAERLVKLLKEKAPGVIVAHEIALILEAGVGYCGSDVLGEFGRLALWGLRLKHGYCTCCERSKLDLPLNFDMCPGCLRKADAAIRAVVKYIADEN